MFGESGFFGFAHHDPADLGKVMWWSHFAAADPQDPALQADLLVRHRGWSQPVPTILGHVTRQALLPVESLAPLRRWSKGRAVLIGDAAHAISPHAGQGASLALEDALVLCRVLRDDPTPAAFSRFQEIRWSRVTAIAEAAAKRGAGKHVLPPAAARSRDLMMRLYLRLAGRNMNRFAYDFEAS